MNIYLTIFLILILLLIKFFTIMEQNREQLALKVSTFDEKGYEIPALSGYPYPAQLVPDILKFLKKGYSLSVSVIVYQPEQVE